MNIANKKIFIAGATGSVGAAILQHLLDKYPKTNIRASYNKTSPYILSKNIEYIKCDLQKFNDCINAIKGCDYAIMAASDSAGSKLMNQEPWRFINPNLIMNSQMMEAFHICNIKRFIYIGTATVYQPFEGYIKEDGLDMNIDPYDTYFGIAWISRYLEKICQFWHNKTGIDAIIVRAANIYGPFSNFNPERSYFIPAIIRKAVDKLDPFLVWGTPDVTRDVIYAEDFANAILALLTNNSIKFDTFNIGSGKKTTVGDVVNWSLKYSRHKPNELKYDTTKPTTIKFRALDITKIIKTTNWEPKISAEEGIKRTVEWWKTNKARWAK
jgi:nucleoside-diphosphate-sugar epimerase